MPEPVRITDVSPRDGLQNEPGVIPTAEKVRLVELLCATGVDEIEVSSFVSPKWVPQLGDAAEVFGLLSPSTFGRGRHPTPSPSGRGLGRGAAKPAAPHNPNPLRPPNNFYPTVPKSSHTTERARALRRDATGPERALWSMLRADRLAGLRFRRQHPIGPYIADFYCPAAKLVIEIDGRSHEHPGAREHDQHRQAWLLASGLSVLRFTNDEVLADVEAVASTILRVVRDPGVDLGHRYARAAGRTTPLPNPLPEGEGAGMPRFSALVPNDKGLQAALDVNRAAGHALISKLSVFTAASETFSRKNTNATIAETIERFKPVIAAAREHDLEVRGYVSCVIACPFEGAIAPAQVARVVELLFGIGVDEIDLGDTIGAGDANSTRAMLQDAIAAAGGHDFNDFDEPNITLHLHDTFARAGECVRAALDLGVISFDGSVAGLGGCPYASTPGQRAPGNISTDLLVRAIHDAGFVTGVDLGRLAQATAYAREIVDRARAAAASANTGGGA